MHRITIACLDLAGTTITDDGSVLTAFAAALEQSGLAPGGPGYDEAMAVVRISMGQSKIEVFRRILGSEQAALDANAAFERSCAALVQAPACGPGPGW